MLEKTRESPLDSKEIKPVSPKEIIPECSLEGLTLKLQYLGLLMRRTDSLKKPLMRERLKAGGEGDDRGWEGWMASPTQWKWVWASSGSWWWTEEAGGLESMGLQRVGHSWVTNTSTVKMLVGRQNLNKITDQISSVVSVLSFWLWLSYSGYVRECPHF